MKSIAKNRRKTASRQKKNPVTRKEPGGKYRVMLENATQGIIVLQDGRLQYANARARNFFGKPIEGLTPEALVNMVHPDDRSMVLGRHSQRLRGEEVPAVYPFRMVAADGQVRWVEISVSLIDWEGRPALLVLAENITARKKMETALAESEKAIRALLDASQATEFMVESDGKILAYNQAFERVFGGDRKPLIGRNINDLISPEENQVNRSKALEVLSTGKPVSFEDYRRGLWLGKKFSPVLDEEGRVTKIACYVNNITERKRAIEALKDNELRYRLLAENVSDFIWSTDRNLRPTYVSPGVTRLLGYSPEEMMAMRLENLLAPGSLSLVWKAYTQEKAKEKGEGRIKEQPRPQVLVLEYRRKDGSSFWAETRSMPVFDSEGKAVSVVGITLDISERREAEEKLRESERRYRLLAENAMDVIWTAGMNLRLTYISPSVTRMRGYTPEEVMAEPLEKAYSADSWALIQKVYAEELAEEKKDTRDLSRSRTLELQHRCKDGSLVWGESKISAIRDAEGNIVEVLGVTRDITKRKNAEEAARRWAEENAVMAEISRIISSSLNIEEVYERFAQEVRKLIEFDNITIGMMNAEERSVAITHVSGIPVPGREVGTFIPLDGSAAEEVYKTRSSLLIHGENLEKAVGKIPKLNAAFEAGMRSMILVPLIREGRVAGILVILSSRPGAYTGAQVEIAERVAAQIAGAIANARLFQDLRRTMEALKESEMRNRTLVEAATISGLGIVVFKKDERGRVLCQFANEEAQKISGYTEEELGRIPFQEIVHPAHREIALTRYRTHAAGEQEPVLYHLIIRHKKGHTVLIEVSAIRSFFHGEDCMIGFFRDISERKRAEKELADYRARLEEMVRDRTARIQELEQQRTEIEKMAATGVLAARIAHEVNNPLAGIKGSFMLIQDAIPPDHPYHHYVARIHGEINRIARIVRQMFELYRSPEEDTEEWEMGQMIQDVVALLKDEARARKVFFQVPVLPVKVRIPAGPIRQVLFNVIKNAVEASPVEGRVRVSFRGGEKEISIQVADEGPGISEKNRPHVFTPFFSTKKGRQKGLGLGLSISKEIVESLGGSIGLKSLRGKGLLCQIDLPKGNRMKKNIDD